jgi:hypothetical protein
MVTVQEKMTWIETERPNYVTKSLIIKSFDRNGVTMKWLEFTNEEKTASERFQCFNWFTSWDDEKDIYQQEVSGQVQVFPAS